jgi:hypothetical protein
MGREASIRACRAFAADFFGFLGALLGQRQKSPTTDTFFGDGHKQLQSAIR